MNKERPELPPELTEFSQDSSYIQEIVKLPPSHLHGEVVSEEQLERLSNQLGQSTIAISALLEISGVSFKLGNNWSTNMETGELMMNAIDLVKPDLPDEYNFHGILHELTAHLRTLIKEPSAAKAENELSKQSKAHHYFNNIMTDIRGNKMIIKKFRGMEEVTSRLYEEYLFPGDDLTDKPLHVQLMNCIIMEEMSPDRKVSVSDEVRQEIDKLRNYEGVDLIKYITNPHKNSREERTAYEALMLAKRFILPIFEKLLQKDIEDKRDTTDYGEHGTQKGEIGNQDGSDSSDNSESPIESKDKQDKSLQDIDGNKDSEKPEDQFTDYYTEITNQHSHEHSEEEPSIDDIAKQIKSIDKAFKESQTEEGKLKKKIEEETGHAFSDYIKYLSRRVELKPYIEDMDEFFESIVKERMVKLHKLSNPQLEGAILDPNTLAQTVVDLRAGTPPQLAYQDYEWHEKEKEVIANFDVFLAVDCSGSMDDELRQLSADAILILLESLDNFMRMVEEQERVGGIKLDLDAKSAIYAFGTEPECVKELSSELSRKEMMDAYHSASKDMGGTATHLALSDIRELIESKSSIVNEPSSYSIVFLITDGAPNSIESMQAEMSLLKNLGVIVLPIAVGEQKENVAKSLGIDTKIIDKPEQLPNYLISKLKDELQARL